MNDNELNDLRDKLRSVIAPPREPELKRDLWPAMLAHLNQPPRIRVPWFDWLLAAVAAAVLIFFPGAIPALLYHL